MARKSTGKRKRFEIFKRDGFKCRYCGRDASQGMLHVDHVIAIADGGTDDTENLVTACADCNLGKAAVPLDASQIQAPHSAEAMREHAEQMRDYLAAAAELDSARAALSNAVIIRWCERVDKEGISSEVATSLDYWIGAIGLQRVFDAVDSVSRRRDMLHGVAHQRKYFVACMRNMRDGL